MHGEKAGLIKQIQELLERIYHLVGPYLPKEWLNLDLSMSQLRVLLLLFTEGPSPMGTLASSSYLPLSTTTGTVDHLIERGLVGREADPHDRRLVIIRLSSKGHELASKLWELGRLRVEEYLEPLSQDQLRVVSEAMGFLLKAAETQNGRQTNSGNGK